MFFKDFIYLFIETHTEREREGKDTGRGKSRLHAGNPTSRITPRAAGGAKPLRHWGCPGLVLNMRKDKVPTSIGEERMASIQIGLKISWLEEE